MTHSTEPSASFPFPGIHSTFDGSAGVVWVETHISSGAATYPITPATNMGVGYQQSVADGAKNLWGEPLVFVEPESEHSAASACEGFALTGGRVTNFTAGQGLILMKEVLYTIAGKRLPVVFNIGARALTVHALNVHAGHDDVMGVVDCGWGMLFARNSQEAVDFCLISRRTAEDSFTPFFNIQDGFLTTHTVETVFRPEPELMKAYLKAPSEVLRNFMDPERPVMTGTVQNQDAYMKGKIAQRSFYEPIRKNLRTNFDEFYRLTGRRYDLIESYRMEDAEYAIIGMGSYMETAKATVDYLREVKKEKVGVISVLSYRPFPHVEIVEALKNVRVISVLERMDEASAPENPLVRDIKSAFADALWGHPDYAGISPQISKMPIVQHGAGGLGGRDVRARDFIAIVENMKQGAAGKLRYCIGVHHSDALVWEGAEPDIRPKGSFSVRGHSIGGYGSVTTNKIIASVCADLFDQHVQAFPKYGAEKKGLPTTYYLTIGPEAVRSHQELNVVDAVIVNDMNALVHSDVLQGMIKGGTIILQAKVNEPSAIWSGVPEAVRSVIREKRIRVFSLDTAAIAREVANTPDLIQRMQGILLLGIFLKVTPFAQQMRLTEKELMAGVEKVIRKYFGKRGEQVIQDNLVCIRRGFSEVMELSGVTIAEGGKK